MRTRLLLPALLATTVLFGGSAAMAATATTIPATTATTAVKATAAKKATTVVKSTGKSTAKSTAAMAKLDVNKASTTALRRLPGVGPKLAQEIISGRPYKDATMLQKRLDKYLSHTAAAKLETHFS